MPPYKIAYNPYGGYDPVKLYQTGRQIWKAAAAAKAGYAAGKGIWRAYKGNRTSKSGASNRDTTAEGDVGYGPHDVKRLYLAKRRPRRKRIFKRKLRGRPLNKRQKLNVRKAIKRQLRMHAAPKYSVFRNCQQLLTAEDKQDIAVGNIGSMHIPNYAVSANGYWEKPNDMLQLLKQVHATLPTQEQQEFTGFTLDAMTYNYRIVNNTEVLRTVDTFEFIAKKTMKANEWSDTTHGTWADERNAEIQNYRQFMRQGLPGEQDSAAAITTALSYDHPGWRPYMTNQVMKWFRFIKHDRMEIAPGGLVDIERHYRVGMKMNAKTIQNNIFVKGVTRIFVVIDTGIPQGSTTQATTTPNVSGTSVEGGGVTFYECKTFKWHINGDRYHRMNTNNLYGTTMTCDQLGTTENQTTTALTI